MHSSAWRCIPPTEVAGRPEETCTCGRNVSSSVDDTHTHTQCRWRPISTNRGSARSWYEPTRWLDKVNHRAPHGHSRPMQRAFWLAVAPTGLTGRTVSPVPTNRSSVRSWYEPTRWIHKVSHRSARLMDTLGSCNAGKNVTADMHQAHMEMHGFLAGTLSLIKRE